MTPGPQNPEEWEHLRGMLPSDGPPEGMGVAFGMGLPAGMENMDQEQIVAMVLPMLVSAVRMLGADAIGKLMDELVHQGSLEVMVLDDLRTAYLVPPTS